MRRSKNIVPILAVALVVLAGIAFYVAYNDAREGVKVMVATQNIPAYTLVQSSQLKATSVPKSSVDSQDITASEYQSKYVNAHKPLITTIQVLQGDRIDSRGVAKNSQSSFDIVSPDERVIAVTTTLPGAVLGTINAGDVVDVQQASGGGTNSASSAYSKVICISTSTNGCAGVLPPGVSLSVTGSSSSSTGSSGGPVNVIIAVPATVATSLAGEQVAMALNPFCVVGSTAAGIRPDQFVSASATGPQCTAPAGRDASTAGALASLPAQSATTATGTAAP